MREMSGRLRIEASDSSSPFAEMKAGSSWQDLSPVSTFSLSLSPDKSRLIISFPGCAIVVGAWPDRCCCVLWRRCFAPSSVHGQPHTVQHLRSVRKLGQVVKSL